MSTFSFCIMSLALLFFIPMNTEPMPREPLRIDVSGDGYVQKKVLKSGYTPDLGPPNTSYVTINYKVIRTNKDAMYEHNDFEFQLGVGNVICCLDLAVASMQKGEISLVHCDKNYVNSEQSDEALDIEIELIKWTKPKKARAIQDIYGVTCRDLHPTNRRLASVPSDDTNINYDQWSFYVLCMIAIMNLIFLPYSCVRWIGGALNITTVYNSKYEEGNPMPKLMV
eukprot:377286_1